MKRKRSPEISQCRASAVGVGGLVLCRSDHRISCDYVQPFGIQHFCIHPRSIDIAAGTVHAQGDGRAKPRR
jgi:hypothetical protein